MARATAWTVGLFGAGAALARAFTMPWLEPVVLLALGIAFLFVSRSGVRRPRAIRTSAPVAIAPGASAALAASPALAAERGPSAAAAPVVVEQSV